MGWYGDQCTRKQKVEHLLEPFNGQRCLRHCYRGNAYKGVLWSVWGVSCRQLHQVRPTALQGWYVDA